MKTITCRNCKRTMAHAGRGLCQACASYLKRHHKHRPKIDGNLNEHRLAELKKRDCPVCRRPLAGFKDRPRRGMCPACYTAHRRNLVDRRVGVFAKPMPAPCLECECGSVKAADAECCVSCAWRDGGHGLGTVISAFRTLGGVATIAALADAAGLTVRSVYRAIAQLSADGRVTRRLQAPALVQDYELKYVPSRTDTGRIDRHDGHAARRGYYVYAGGGGSGGPETPVYVFHDRPYGDRNAA